jgi:hypothetical protein
MTLEELKGEFARMSREEKQRFMEEVGLNLCRDMMADKAFMQRMFPRCMEMMQDMPVEMRRQMEQMTRGAGRAR